MVRKETWKNADYPNRIPIWAKNAPPQYRAYNKLNTDNTNKFSKGSLDEFHIKGIIKGLRRTGYKVIRILNMFGDVEVYFRKKTKVKGGKK